MSTRLAWSLALVLFLSHQATGREPYRDLSTAGAGFYGPGRELEAPDTLSVVRLGLTGPAKTPAGKQLRQGVELALEEANTKGGYRGLPYRIVFRPDDGPWGVIARQVVRLSQEDEVWTIIGALDGERAHAAELVAAKLWIPVVTPGAGDRTIDYANVPWVFRCLPDDGSQAEVLLQGARERGWERLVVVSEGTRDARVAVDRLREAARRHPYTVALHVEYPPHDPTTAIPQIVQTPADALVVWGRPAGALALIAGLRREGLSTPILGPALLALPEVAAHGDELGELLVAAPVDLSSPGPSLQHFRQRFRAETGVEPSYIGIFAYDATRLVIAAIERAGLNRARIRDELPQVSFTGLTGDFSFNSLGGRREQPVLMALRQGRWVRP